MVFFSLQKTALLWLDVNLSTDSPQIPALSGFIPWGTNRRVRRKSKRWVESFLCQRNPAGAAREDQSCFRRWGWELRMVPGWGIPERHQRLWGTQTEAGKAGESEILTQEWCKHQTHWGCRGRSQNPRPAGTPGAECGLRASGLQEPAGALVRSQNLGAAEAPGRLQSPPQHHQSHGAAVSLGSQTGPQSLKVTRTRS